MDAIKKDWRTIFQYGIAGIMVVGFILIIFAMLFHLVPEENNTLLNVMVGAYGTATMTVVNFLFGSTKSSADKNEMLFKSSPLEQSKDSKE